MDEVNQWMAGLVANKEKSDVELHVDVMHDVMQESCTFVIPAHSFVLRHVSEVFDTMLDPGKFKEGATGVAEIKVYGSKADALSFIKYLYTKKLPTLDMNSYVALIRTADFYDMTNLIEKCEKKLRTGVTPFSVCNIYSTLRDVSSKAFIDYCKGVMLRFAFLIFGEKLQVTLPENAMVFLLNSKKLNALNEVQVLQAAWDWGRSKCILENTGIPKEPKEMITSLLPLIHWNDISEVETGSPLFELYVHYKNNLTTSVNREVENAISLSRFANVLNIHEDMSLLYSNLEWVSLKGKYTLITFTSDHSVLLAGLEMHLNVSTYQINAEDLLNIYVNALRIEKYSCDAAIPKRSSSDLPNYCNVFTLSFHKQVVLKANKVHRIYFEGLRLSYQAQSLKLNSTASESGILGSDEEVRFSVCDDVVAIQKLFYYVRD